MANTPEGDVKQWLKRRLKEELPVGYMYMPPGGVFGRAGVPDLLCVWRGVFLAIEVKSGDPKAKVTAIQRRQLELIRDAGGIAAVMRGKDEAKLAAILSEVRRRVNESRI